MLASFCLNCVITKFKQLGGAYQIVTMWMLYLLGIYVCYKFLEKKGEPIDLGVMIALGAISLVITLCKIIENRKAKGWNKYVYILTSIPIINYLTFTTNDWVFFILSMLGIVVSFLLFAFENQIRNKLLIVITQVLIIILSLWIYCPYIPPFKGKPIYVDFDPRCATCSLIIEEQDSVYTFVDGGWKKSSILNYNFYKVDSSPLCKSYKLLALKGFEEVNPILLVKPIGLFPFDFQNQNVSIVSCGACWKEIIKWQSDDNDKILQYTAKEAIAFLDVFSKHSSESIDALKGINVFLGNEIASNVDEALSDSTILKEAALCSCSLGMSLGMLNALIEDLICNNNINEAFQLFELQFGFTAYNQPIFKDVRTNLTLHIGDSIMSITDDEIKSYTVSLRVRNKFWNICHSLAKAYQTECMDSDSEKILSFLECNRETLISCYTEECKLDAIELEQLLNQMTNQIQALDAIFMNHDKTANIRKYCKELQEKLVDELRNDHQDHSYDMFFLSKLANVTKILAADSSARDTYDECVEISFMKIHELENEINEQVKLTEEMREKLSGAIQSLGISRLMTNVVTKTRNRTQDVLIK
jgi:hypothetical protein